MKKSSFSGGGSGTGRSASGDEAVAMKVADVRSTPAKMGGSGTGMKEVGIKASGGMSSVPSAASIGTMLGPQTGAKSYNSLAKCDAIKQDSTLGSQTSNKGYYGR